MAVLQKMKDMPEEWEKILEHYDELVEKHKDDIRHLEDWSKKQAHLPRLSKHELVEILYAGHVSLEQSKQIMDSYLTVKTKHRDTIFKDRTADLKEVKRTLNIIETCLPDTKYNGRRLYFSRLVDSDASHMDFPQDMKVFTAACEFEMARDFSHKGMIIMFDAAGLHLGHVARVNLTTVAHVFEFLETVEGLFAEIHVFNIHSVVQYLLTLVRPFFTKRIQEMLHFHTSSQMEEFHEKYVPKKYMPSNYGGELPSTAQLDEQFKKRFLDARAWVKLMESDQYYVDERKRPKDSTNKDKMIGSFRKLDID